MSELAANKRIIQKAVPPQTPYELPHVQLRAQVRAAITKSHNSQDMHVLHRKDGRQRGESSNLGTDGAAAGCPVSSVCHVACV